MSKKLSADLALLYCQRALKLCKTARALIAEGAHKRAAEICLYISTLCVQNVNLSCRKESELCKASAENRLKGNIELAEKLCLEARRICPKNYEIRGL